MVKQKFRGIWLFGLSGVGQTYASLLINKHVKNSVLIDGDKVREYISTDLNYSKKHRNIQIKRLFGIGKIVKDSNCYPIISSVWMNKVISAKLKNENIQLIKLKSEMKLIFKNHPTYKNKKDVVGKDINFTKFDCEEILNDRNNELWTKLKKLI